METARTRNGVITGTETETAAEEVSGKIGLSAALKTTIVKKDILTAREMEVTINADVEAVIVKDILTAREMEVTINADVAAAMVAYVEAMDYVEVVSCAAVEGFVEGAASGVVSFADFVEGAALGVVVYAAAVNVRTQERR